MSKKREFLTKMLEFMGELLELSDVIDMDAISNKQKLRLRLRRVMIDALMDGFSRCDFDSDEAEVDALELISEAIEDFKELVENFPKKSENNTEN